MASVCGSTLALMDGGVPILTPVAGISIGLVMQGDAYELLTDIQGPEDHYGDMDFKVAGTEKGITAIQLDIKVSGISVSILEEALKRARLARESILGTMSKAISSPRKTVSEHAPHIVTTTIPQDKIGLLIGPSGKTIKKIIADTGCLSIDIDDDGKVFITGKSGTTEKALETVKEMTRVFAVGDSLEGEVTKITTFGIFVRLDPKTEGLVHVSEIAPFQIDSISDYVNVGDRVPVIIKEIDVRKRLNLSIKAVHPEFFDQKHEQRSAKQRK
jgi:polyribonucleotide nucleotidyltransferase